jgi:hypothetical protein
MKQKLFKFFDAFIWLPKLIVVWILLCFINVDAAPRYVPMTCAKWGAVAEQFAIARDKKVPELVMQKQVMDDTSAGKLFYRYQRTNLLVLQGVYENPSLRDAAPETVRHITEIVCHDAHWEAQ